jgi:hypothetical protein
MTSTSPLRNLPLTTANLPERVVRPAGVGAVMTAGDACSGGFGHVDF